MQFRNLRGCYIHLEGQVLTKQGQLLDLLIRLCHWLFDNAFLLLVMDCIQKQIYTTYILFVNILFCFFSLLTRFNLFSLIGKMGNQSDDG